LGLCLCGITFAFREQGRGQLGQTPSLASPLPKIFFTPGRDAQLHSLKGISGINSDLT
jgi:hypothetical protein